MKICPICLNENDDKSSICTICGTALNSGFRSKDGDSPLYLPKHSLLKNSTYQILKVLGEGGFGVTYKGTELKTGKQVAIKELLPERAARTDNNQIVWSPQARNQKNLILQKFKEEATYLSRFNHPSIVRVHDFFEENNTAYMVMDYVEGKTLARILKELKKDEYIQESVARQYLSKILSAISIIHQNGILHRDIKPENVIIDVHDNPVLIDFGAAREFLSGTVSNMTRLLTECYAPPEQYLSKSELGPFTDIYALSATFYEILTKELVPDSLSRIQKDDLKPPATIRPDLSTNINIVLLKGLEIKPSNRFQSASEMLEELNSSINLLKLARDCAKKGHHQKSVELYERYLSKDNYDSTAYVELSMVCCYVSKDKALKIAKLAIDKQPTDGRAYGVLGLILCQKGNNKEGIYYLNKALKLTPNELWIQINLAIALFNNNDVKECDLLISKILSNYPNQLESIVLKAIITYKLGHWKDVIKLTRSLFSTIPSLNVHRFQLFKELLYPLLIQAYSKITSTRSNDIVNSINEYVRDFPNISKSWTWLGFYNLTSGFFQKAIENYLLALSRVHDNSEKVHILFNLSYCYYFIGNYQKCINFLEQCKEVNNNDYYILSFLGRSLSMVGNWHISRCYIEKSIILNNNFAQSYHNLGFVLTQIFKQKHDMTDTKLINQILRAYKKAEEIYKLNGQDEKAALIQQYLIRAKVTNHYPYEQ